MALERESIRIAPPPQLSPQTRNVIRWRGQHLATAARALQRAELGWEWADVPRYDLYDGRTTIKATPTPSPRRMMFASHHRVWIPPANTQPFQVGLHPIDLTPGMLEDAIVRMRTRAALEAWRTYVWTAFPPTVYRAHRRDGIVPSDEARFATELRIAVGILGWIATRHELGDWKPRVGRDS